MVCRDRLWSHCWVPAGLQEPLGGSLLTVFKKKKRVRKMQTWAAVKIWVFLSQPEVLSPHLSWGS